MRKNKNQKIFFGGTISAAIFFVVWNFLAEFIGFTWQELLISLLYGGYTLLAHFLMRKKGIWNVLSYFMLIVPIILALLWIVFCIGMIQWARNY